jgi:4-oxalocrotonate tautomerase
MPIVTVGWMAGRTQEQKRALAARITAAVSEVGNVEPSTVWIHFNDVAAEDWAVAGTLVVDEKH